MAGAISGPRPEVADNAPKIVSFQIPVDRIGEVIGPKGKVINTLQAETGADITVDDDGMFGLVTIGAKDSSAVDEARKRIFLIVEPPEADVGGVYPGKVVNITKFGAFVNILPGRDGLLHISKIGGGKRVDRVEDVLSLGQELEVKVDDIDPQGKVSLSLVGDPPAPTGGGGPSSSSDRGSDRGGDRDRDRGGSRSGGSSGSSGGPATPATPVASFESAFEAELTTELGDLGPAPVSGGGDRERGDDRRPRRPRRR
jgi:polyribonucleotide nucleotidyltransferase